MSNSITNFDNLTITSDFLFKHIMQRKRICKHLLEEALQTKIADITYLESEQTLDVYPDSRGIRLDIKLADANGTHYSLEMQVKNTINSSTGNSLLPVLKAKYPTIYRAFTIILTTILSPVISLKKLLILSSISKMIRK